MNRLQDPQRHDDLLNYRLKRLVTLGGAPAIRLCEGRYGISRTEWRLLAALVEAGAMSPTRLTELAQFEPARVSRSLRRLTAKGLVQRQVDADDARRALVAATPSGQAMHGALWPQLAQINRRLMNALDDAEAAALDVCLAKLMAEAERVHREGGGVDARTDRRLGGSRRFWDASID